jgi:hypothetical protein
MLKRVQWHQFIAWALHLHKNSETALMYSILTHILRQTPINFQKFEACKLPHGLWGYSRVHLETINFLGKQSSTGHSLLTMQIGIWVRWIFFCQKCVSLPFMRNAETHYEQVLGSSHENVVSQVASMFSTNNGVTSDHPHNSCKVIGNMGKINPDTLLIRTVFNYISTMRIIQILSPTAHSIGGQSPPMRTI